MQGHRKRIDLPEYRSALDREGEIEIGVQARRQRRRTLIIAGMGIVMIAGAVWLNWWLRGADDGPARDDRSRIKVRCLRCEYTGVVEVKLGQPFPLICPECGQRACKRLWRCQVCGEEFVFEGPRGETVACECGSTAVGAAPVPDP